MRINRIWGLVLILPSLLMGSLMEIEHMDAILPFLYRVSSDQLLIVFDIDNTLMRPNQHLGSVAWGEHLIEKLKSKGVESKHAAWINKKSEVLCASLEKNDIRPQLIIFVDDKQHHVEDIEHACQDRGIECIGLRFSGADEYVKQFNPAVADIQWEAFPKMLSDEEALQSIKLRACEENCPL